MKRPNLLTSSMDWEMTSGHVKRRQIVFKTYARASPVEHWKTNPSLSGPNPDALPVAAIRQKEHKTEDDRWNNSRLPKKKKQCLRCKLTHNELRIHVIWEQRDERDKQGGRTKDNITSTGGWNKNRCLRPLFKYQLKARELDKMMVQVMGRGWRGFLCHSSVWWYYMRWKYKHDKYIYRSWIWVHVDVHELDEGSGLWVDYRGKEILEGTDFSSRMNIASCLGYLWR